MNTFQIIFGTITSVGGLAGLAALMTAINQRRKIHAEATRIGVDSDMVISDKALDMYRLARLEAQEAKRESRNCQRMVEALRDHVDELEDLMRSAGMRPPPFVAPTMTKKSQ